MKNRISIVYQGALLCAWLASAFFLPKVSANTAPLTLKQALASALAGDPWHQGNELKRQAVLEESGAVTALPDPKLNLSIANLPIDSFDINQEGMTQLKVGVSQVFPRGNTLKLRQQKQLKNHALLGFKSQLRQAQITQTVSQLYLDAWLAQQSAGLIEQNRVLFEQLVDMTEKSYESAWGKARQQDVIRAELELSRLDERLSRIWQGFDQSYQKLSEWLPLNLNFSQGTLASPQPTVEPLKSIAKGDWARLSTTLNQHPLIRAVEQKHAMANTDVAIAKQSYKPEWGVNASYGYRANDLSGNSRSDLFTLGVTVDIPLFTHSRQDKQVSAATYRAEAVETDKLLLLRKLRAEFDSLTAQIQRLDRRYERYQTRLLTQSRQHAEAALNAYTADAGDFAEVMRAHIAELNTRIEALQLKVERLKKVVQLNYLLVGELY